MLLTAQPIDGIEIGPKALKLTNERVAQWEKQWDAGKVERFELSGGAGKTWTRALGALPFRSCVAWAKDRWIAVGTSGSDESTDDGATWKALDGENCNSVAFAGAGAGWAVGPKGRVAKFAR